MVVAIKDTFTGAVDDLIASHVGEVGATWTNGIHANIGVGNNGKLTGDGYVYGAVNASGASHNYKASGSLSHVTSGIITIDFDIRKVGVPSNQSVGVVLLCKDPNYVVRIWHSVASNQMALDVVYLPTPSVPVGFAIGFTVTTTKHIKIEVNISTGRIIVYQDGVSLINSVAAAAYVTPGFDQMAVMLYNPTATPATITDGYHFGNLEVDDGVSGGGGHVPKLQISGSFLIDIVSI